jgi:hypothetical protein
VSTTTPTQTSTQPQPQTTAPSPPAPKAKAKTQTSTPKSTNNTADSNKEVKKETDGKETVSSATIKQAPTNDNQNIQSPKEGQPVREKTKRQRKREREKAAKRAKKEAAAAAAAAAATGVSTEGAAATTVNIVETQPSKSKPATNNIAAEQMKTVNTTTPSPTVKILPSSTPKKVPPQPKTTAPTSKKQPPPPTTKPVSSSTPISKAPKQEVKAKQKPTKQPPKQPPSNEKLDFGVKTLEEILAEKNAAQAKATTPPPKAQVNKTEKRKESENSPQQPNVKRPRLSEENTPSPTSTSASSVVSKSNDVVEPKKNANNVSTESITPQANQNNNPSQTEETDEILEGFEGDMEGLEDVDINIDEEELEID